MSADNSVDVLAGLSITRKAGPLDPTAICVGGTAKRTEAWQELPFKKQKYAVHSQREREVKRLTSFYVLLQNV
jgi:hypothetical protein